jgi:hypothetical protein
MKCLITLSFDKSTNFYCLQGNPDDIPRYEIYLTYKELHQVRDMINDAIRIAGKNNAT